MTQMTTVRTQDLQWMLGRAIAREEARLGAELQDRLLGLPVQDIIERMWILTPPSRFSRPGQPQMAIDIDRLTRGAGVYIPESSKRVLSSIQESPSRAETGDLGFIDAFFAPYYAPFSGSDSASIYQWMICSRRIRWAPRGYPGDTAGIVFGPGPFDSRSIEPPVAGDPFFCPPRPDIYRNSATQELGRYFGLDLSKPWRELKPILLNIENLLKLIGDPVMHPAGPSYPLPAPARITGYWWELAQGGLRELVRQPGILTEDAARLWVTLSLLTHYNELVAFARAEMEKSARSEREAMIILTVALVAFGLVLSVAIGPLVAAGFKIASGALTEVEKQDAAKDLNSAAKELQTTDPAFAGQVQWSAEYIQRMLNESSRPAGTAPPGQGGILEVAVGIGLPTLLSVGISLLKR